MIISVGILWGKAINIQYYGYMELADNVPYSVGCSFGDIWVLCEKWLTMFYVWTGKNVEV